jgi:choline transport protein
MAAANVDTKGPTIAEEQGYEPQDGAKSCVSVKYLGTKGDKSQMRMLGRTQKTRRVFTFITILGFGSTLIVTWEVLLTKIGLILVTGGTAGMFWGFLFDLISWILVYLSLSEMASI